VIAHPVGDCKKKSTYPLPTRCGGFDLVRKIITYPVLGVGRLSLTRRHTTSSGLESSYCSGSAMANPSRTFAVEHSGFS
jgi:hypothetical protein